MISQRLRTIRLKARLCQARAGHPHRGQVVPELRRARGHSHKRLANASCHAIITPSVED